MRVRGPLFFVGAIGIAAATLASLNVSPAIPGVAGARRANVHANSPAHVSAFSGCTISIPCPSISISFSPNTPLGLGTERSGLFTATFTNLTPAAESIAVKCVTLSAQFPCSATNLGTYWVPGSQDVTVNYTTKGIGTFGQKIIGTVPGQDPKMLIGTKWYWSADTSVMTGGVSGVSIGSFLMPGRGQIISSADTILIVFNHPSGVDSTTFKLFLNGADKTSSSHWTANSIYMTGVTLPDSQADTVAGYGCAVNGRCDSVPRVVFYSKDPPTPPNVGMWLSDASLPVPTDNVTALEVPGAFAQPPDSLKGCPVHPGDPSFTFNGGYLSQPAWGSFPTGLLAVPLGSAAQGDTVLEIATSNHDYLPSDTGSVCGKFSYLPDTAYNWNFWTGIPATPQSDSMWAGYPYRDHRVTDPPGGGGFAPIQGGGGSGNGHGNGKGGNGNGGGPGPFLLAAGAMDPDSVEMWLNGTQVVRHGVPIDTFVHVVQNIPLIADYKFGANDPLMNRYDVSSPGTSPNGGWNELITSMADSTGHRTKGRTRFIQLKPMPRRPVSVSALRSYSKVEQNQCTAFGVFQCGGLMLTEAIPGFTTRDRDRSLHLVYRSSSQKAPTVLPIQLYVSAFQQDPDSFLVFSKSAGSSAVDTLHYFGVTHPTGAQASRPGLQRWWSQYMDLGAEFSPPDTGTARIRPDTIVIRAKYDTVTQDNVLIQEVTQIYLSDSNSTRVGAGWALAEQSRLILGQQSQGAPAAIWLGGDGSYEIFRQVSNLWVSPPGETGRLVDSTQAAPLPAGHVLYLSSGASVGFRGTDGRQVWTADLLGNKTRFVYASSTSSRLDSIVDPSKMAYRFKYNTSGNGTNLVSDIWMRDSANDTARIATLAYNSTNQLRSITIWRSGTQGDSTRFAYQSNRFAGAYLDSLIDPRNPGTGTPTIVTTFAYDTVLYTPISMTRPSDRFGKLTEWNRDVWRRAVPTDSFGRRWGGTAQPQAGLLFPSQMRGTFEDFAGQPTDVMADKFGGPTWVDEIAPPPVVISVVGGIPLYQSMGSDDIRSITRDTVGRVIKIVHDPDSSAFSDSVMYTYDALGRVDTIARNTLLYPAGSRVLDTTTFVFDSVTIGTSGQWCSRLKSMKDPMQGADTVSYPSDSSVSACLPTKTRDVSGDTTHYTYGTLNAGVASGVRPISIGDATGVVTSAQYDAKTWNTSASIVSAAHDTSRIYYDLFGRPDSSFDGVRARSVYYHDLSARVIATRTGTGPGSATAFTTRDAAGNITRVRVFAGQAGSGNDTLPISGAIVDTTFYYYNNLSQLDSTLTPGHRRTKYTRDPRGAPLWEYTGNGGYIARMYNWQGKLSYENTSATDPNYTVDGQPFAASNVTALYDTIGLAPGATLSNGQVHIEDFDAKGRLDSMTTQDLGLNSQLLHRSYGYSRTNQLVADTLILSAGITVVRTYQYNRRGQRIMAATNVTPTGGSVTEPIDTTRYYYDSLSAHLDSMIETVDSATHVLRVAKVRWGYDKAQRDTVRGILVGAGTTELATHYAYDSAGRVALMRDSTSAGTWYELSNTTYDAVSRLVGALEIGPCSGSTPSCHVSRRDVETYDSLGTGRLTYSYNSDADYYWTYDAFGNRLTESWTQYVSPNGSGNDTTKVAVDNSLVRVFNAGSGGLINHFYNDQAGNRLMQRDSANSGGVDYGVRQAMSYTAKNQLFFSAVPSAQTAGGFDITFNWYDPSGQRVITKTDYEPSWNGAISPTANSGTWTYYFYDGSDIALTAAKIGGTWKVTSRYLTGGVDQPLAGRFVNLGGTVTENLGFVEDKQGTTLAAMLANGSQESNAIYYGKNAFGAYVAAPSGLGSQSGTIGSQNGFGGASTPSSSTGFTYMRNRWYDPQTGRFLTQDPIGLAGGVNLYAYAGNDPIQYSDPFGDTTEVGFRPLQNGMGAIAVHAAIRVGGNGQWHEVQLLPDDPQQNGHSGDGNNDVTVSTGNEGPAESQFSWTALPVPAGQTQAQFDHNTLKAAADVGKKFQGKKYVSAGRANSNQFVHQIVKQAGGTIPQSAIPADKIAPGICGGGTKPQDEGTAC